jgi:hypothetical protein
MSLDFENGFGVKKVRRQQSSGYGRQILDQGGCQIGWL